MTGRKVLVQPGRKVIILVSMGLLLASYSVFVFFPIGYGLYSSFFLWNPLQNIYDFLGLANYTDTLKSPDFWKAMFNTVYFTAGSLTLTVILGLVVAGLIHALKKFTGFYRGVYFLPVITSMVAVALIWKFMYNTESGFFNSVLMALGTHRVRWLQNPYIVMPAIFVVEAWKDIGYALVLLLAGMYDVDISLYESAEIDGASRFNQFFYITLPLIKRAMTILIITKLIDYLQVFTPIYFMTQGGPGKETYSVSFLIYKDAFTYHNFGSASAVSFLLFIVIFLFSIAQLGLARSRE